MSGTYDLHLVMLSLAIAIMASYTASDLTNRVSESVSSPRKAWLWLSAGALAMGSGIWARIPFQQGRWSCRSAELLRRGRIVSVATTWETSAA